MTLQQAIQTDSYIICANIEERILIANELRKMGVKKKGWTYDNELVIRIFSEGVYVTVTHAPRYYPQYPASRLLTSKTENI